MTIRYRTLCALLACILAPVLASRADDLKDYYEQQKAEIAPTFKAPELGSDITVTLASGKKRNGILMKLTHTEVSLMTEAGSVAYKTTALHETSRAQLFADDYAHTKALARTREYKQQLHAEGIKDEQAGTHAGNISVTAKVEKKSDKEVEEDETENKQTGDTRTTTTTTKTKSETQKLTVTISNTTTHPDTYILAWASFAKSPSGDSITIHDKGSENITVEARQRARHEIIAETLTVTEVTVEQTSSNYGASSDPQINKSGKEPAGYVVVLKHGDTVLDKKASSNTYLSDEWLRKIN